MIVFGVFAALTALLVWFYGFKLQAPLAAAVACAGLLLLAAGVLMLITRPRRKALPIIMAAVGGALLFVGAFILPIFAPHTDSVRHFDRTWDISSIGSIELITVTCPAEIFESLGYEVKNEVPREEWAALLQALAGLDYISNAAENPPPIGRGQTGVLITYYQPKNDSKHFIYAQHSPTYDAASSDGAYLKDYDCWCDSAEWERVLAPYLGD